MLVVLLQSHYVMRHWWKNGKVVFVVRITTSSIMPMELRGSLIMIFTTTVRLPQNMLVKWSKWWRTMESNFQVTSFQVELRMSLMWTLSRVCMVVMLHSSIRLTWWKLPEPWIRSFFRSKCSENGGTIEKPNTTLCVRVVGEWSRPHETILTTIGHACGRNVHGRHLRMVVLRE